MSDEGKGPNKAITAAIKKLLKECEGDIPEGKEASIKVKVEVIKAAMVWEKIQHGIYERAGEGSEWGNDPDGQ